VVTSFDEAAVAQVRALAPALRTGLLGGTADATGEMARAVAVAASWYLPRVESLPSDVDALKEIVMAARGHGLDVVPWTVNETAMLAALGHAGVRGVVTDVPEIAGRVLGRR